ncbi:MAG: putative lipid II flippase FtsW [Actinomycetota bacterium]|nr:putative lipid II flippase FtsW [Actinomycetota bacterium]
MTALSLSRLGPKARKRAAAQPIEYNLLLTATLCLLALGVVMVFSASSTTSLLGKSGDSAYYLKRTLLFGAAGLLVMRVLSLRGARLLRPLTPLLVAASFFLLLAVLAPGIGSSANGARRWIGAGMFQIQPSELAKISLILYGAHLLATRPKMTRELRTLMPYLALVGLAALLMVAEPDLGTAIVLCLAAAALLVASGVKIRHLALLAMAIGVVVLLAIAIEPYRMQRVTGFLNPSGDPNGAGFQAIQAKIALGSGGIFGVGLGQSLQKAFYLPEAHTDMIAAVIGEELGLVGISMLVGLYSLFGYAGLRTAQRARDRYGKLLAAGLTSLILVQAIVNLFAVLGLAPLTGVPLPFVSYGNSSLLVTLAATGLLLNVARDGRASAPARRVPRRASASARRGRGAARLRVVEGGRGSRTAGQARGRSDSRRAKSRNSRGGDRRARGAGARRRRRASG